MDCANGEYVTFADSDDVLHPLLYETLIRNLSSDHSIAMTLFTRNLKDLGKDFLNLKQDPKNYEQLVPIMLGSSNIYHTCCKLVYNKLYPRQLIGNERFKNLTTSEDEEFNLRIFKNADKVVTIPKQLYYWRPRTGSLTNSGLGLVSISNLKSFKEEYKTLQPLNNEIAPNVYTRAIKLLLNARYYNKANKAVISELRDFRNQFLHLFLHCNQIKFTTRTIYFAMWIFPILYSTFILIMEYRAVHKTI